SEMPEPLTPTKQMLKTAENINCQVPLSCIGQCQYKICDKNNRPTFVNYEVPPTKNHVEDRDKYWAEFLKAQQDSTANYLYKMKIFGHNKDPTLVRKQPFPETLKLSSEKQLQYMEQLQNWQLLDLATLNYMLIIARHQNTNLTPQELKQFQYVCQQLIERKTPKDCHRNYFKPDAIFLKCMVEIDPYELAYLKNILETEGKLSQEQFLYLVNFVERLQEMPVERRDQYLKLLHERNILKTPRFDVLVEFMRNKAKRFDRQKLKLMLDQLLKLMDVGPCTPEPEEIPYQIPPKFTTDYDYGRLSKALVHLMKPKVIPNIVRVMELRNFLNYVLRLPPYQMEYVFYDMKSKNLLHYTVYNFVRNFVCSGQFGKGDPERIRTMLSLMKQITEGPPRPGIIYKVDMPPLKGPVRWPVQKPPSKTETETEIKTPLPPVSEVVVKETEKKPEETKKDETKEPEKDKDQKKKRWCQERCRQERRSQKRRRSKEEATKEEKEINCLAHTRGEIIRTLLCYPINKSETAEPSNFQRIVCEIKHLKGFSLELHRSLYRVGPEVMGCIVFSFKKRRNRKSNKVKNGNE
ncbi:hypothetical protein DOY81_005864, partial [Sarcophaga bullata]